MTVYEASEAFFLSILNPVSFEALSCHERSIRLFDIAEAERFEGAESIIRFTAAEAFTLPPVLVFPDSDGFLSTLFKIISFTWA